MLGEWVRINRNVDFVGDCSNAKPGVDVGKVCATEAGTRGTRRAYYLGPTFSENTALAILEQSLQDETWSVLSVTNRDPSAGAIPGIPWPLQVGDQIIIIGLGDVDCLSIREQPTQSAAKDELHARRHEGHHPGGPGGRRDLHLVAHRRRRLQRLGCQRVDAPSGGDRRRPDAAYPRPDAVA